MLFHLGKKKNEADEQFRSNLTLTNETNELPFEKEESKRKRWWGEFRLFYYKKDWISFQI